MYFYVLMKIMTKPLCNKNVFFYTFLYYFLSVEDSRDSKTNIEDLLAEKGEKVRKISGNEVSEYLESSTDKK